jgi:hypothetical protein
MLVGTHIDLFPGRGAQWQKILLQRKDKGQATGIFCLLDLFPEKRGVRSQENFLQRMSLGEAAYVFC